MNPAQLAGFYTKLNVWGSLGLNFEYDGGPIIDIGGPIFLDKLRILEGSTSFHEGSVLSPGQLFWGLHVCLAPFRYFGGPFEFFEGHILPSVKHNPIRFFFYKSWTCPYNMQGPSYIALKFRGSASSPVQIGRSLRKQGEVIDRKKQSLIRLFSNWDKKKTQEKTVTDQTATCFPSWEIWLVNLKYTWSCCHCILSICLQVSTYLKSLVSLIYCRPEPFQVKMLRNSSYTKERKVSR